MAARITERSCLYCRHGRVQGAGRVECMNACSERRGMRMRKNDSCPDWERERRR